MRSSEPEEILVRSPAHAQTLQKHHDKIQDITNMVLDMYNISGEERIRDMCNNLILVCLRK